MPLRQRSKTLILTICCVLVAWACIGQFDWHARAEARPETSEYEELKLFTSVLSIVRRSYVEEVDVKSLIQGAIEGMLNKLDPHSSYMSPDVYKEMQIDTQGEFGGLGIEITIRDGVLVIVSPIVDTPAFRAGLEAGDQILKVGDRFTKDLGIMDAVKLMRGPKGSSISLTIMRESFDKPREFTLVREIIKIRSVKFKTIEDGFGYVRIAQFQERTAADLAKGLKSLHQENSAGLRGLILDLRNNPGGLLDQAVKVSDAFIASGKIVYTVGREEGSSVEFNAHAEGTEGDYPIVVLINGGSASASEIVAGALQDHKRGLVLGTQSFGKGSVQTIIPLSESTGLRLTTSRYYTPNGNSIQAKGITPDIIVAPMELKEIDEYHGVREKDLNNHIETPGTAPSKGKGPEGRFSPDKEDRADYQLMRALDLLKGWQILKGLRPAA